MRDDLNGRVSPFGNPRIKAYSQLPMAYRSVSRPSSPLNAKAFTKCPLRRLIGSYVKANAPTYEPKLDCEIITRWPRWHLEINPAVLDVFTNFVKQRDCPGEPVQPNKTGAFSRSIMRHPAMPTRAAVWQMVGTGRFELPTSRLSVVRSNQLSYAPVTL